MTSLTSRNDPEFRKTIEELDEKFWKTMEHELYLHNINNSSTTEPNDGDQSKYTNRPGHNLLD
jgi:hypothetical protein